MLNLFRGVLTHPWMGGYVPCMGPNTWILSTRRVQHNQDTPSIPLSSPRFPFFYYWPTTVHTRGFFTLPVDFPPPVTPTNGWGAHGGGLSMSRVPCRALVVFMRKSAEGIVVASGGHCVIYKRKVEYCVTWRGSVLCIDVSRSTAPKTR